VFAIRLPAFEIRRRLRRRTAAWALPLLCLAGAAATAAGAEELSLYQQRAQYKNALDLLTAGRIEGFRKARASLRGYVLVPYLDYHELQSRLSSASADDIMAFRSEHADLPVADIIFDRWLKGLGSRRDWQTLIRYHEPSDDVELTCYYLRALLATGQREGAFAPVAELWTVGSSQPNVCDPLFEAWIDSGQLTESMVWQRLTLALDQNARTLARYLLRFFEGTAAKDAENYYNVHVSPSNITHTSRYHGNQERGREVIRHGLERLAARDAQAAASAWRTYQRRYPFDAETSAAIDVAIAVGNARQGVFPKGAEAAKALPDRAAGDMAEAAIQGENWSQAAYWIDRMSGDDRQQRRWQYWLARSLAASVMNSERAELTYQALAEDRDYYGFLAAEQIGRPVRLNDEPLQVSAIRLNQLSRRPPVARAVELFAVGDLVNARREWRDLLPELSDEERAAAAALAHSIGWTSQAISTASYGPLRDTLELRFPLAFPDSFQRVSHATTVSQSFLLAIARQESAFDPRARSHANARGLMQLMYPTATEIARRVGVSAPTVTELYDPSVNIELAGHHLAALLDRYGQQRPLAAAAYNAGEARVERWTRARSGTAMDVWIETIPFSETRNYVKNVLAFAQVYSQLMNNPVPMLQVHEAALR